MAALSYARISWQWDVWDETVKSPYSGKWYKVGDADINISRDKSDWIFGTLFLAIGPVWVFLLEGLGIGGWAWVLGEMLIADGRASLTIFTFLAVLVLLGRRREFHFFYLNLPPLLPVREVFCRCPPPHLIGDYSGCPGHQPFEPEYDDQKFRSGWWTAIWKLRLGRLILIGPRCSSCR